MKIAYNVYQIRIQKNMSLRKLSQLSGVSRSQINDIENEKHHPTVLTLCLLAVALEVSPYTLFAMVSDISDK